MRRTTVLCTSLALVACGAPDSENAKAPEGNAARVEAPDPGAAAPPGASSQAAPASAAAQATSEEVDCSGMPSFVALTRDAAIDGCFISQAGPGFGNGTIIFHSGLTPDALVAFYRGKARASGMADGPQPDGAGSYSALDGSKRTIKVTTRRGDGGRLRVTLNWTQDE